MSPKTCLQYSCFDAAVPCVRQDILADAFRKRLEPLWDGWHEQVMQKAQALGISIGERVAVDGTLSAAMASRRRLVNLKTLAKRREELEQAVAANANGNLPETQPYWMAHVRFGLVFHLDL